MDGKSCILCPLVLLQCRCSGAGYKPTLRMVSCNRRCVAVRGQPAIAGDDYSKRSSSPTCRLASVPLVTHFHKMLVVFAELRSDSSPEWDVSQEHGCVTSHRGCNGALSDKLCQVCSIWKCSIYPEWSQYHMYGEKFCSVSVLPFSSEDATTSRATCTLILAVVKRRT